MLKSDFIFILGKVEHIQENFEAALNLYVKAVKLNPQNYSAQYCLAKVHFNNRNYQESENCLNVVLSN